MLDNNYEGDTFGVSEINESPTNPMAANNEQPNTEIVHDKAPKRKRLTVAIAVLCVLAVCVIAVGAILIGPYIKVFAAKQALAGKTYELWEEQMSEYSFSISWLYFNSDGTGTMDSYSYTSGKKPSASVKEVEYEVNVMENGEIAVWMGPSVYIVEFEGMDISCLTDLNTGAQYIPSNREGITPIVQYAAAAAKAMDEYQTAHLKEKAIDYFCEVTYWKNTKYKFDNLIPIVFEEYDLSVEKYQGNGTQYQITVSGIYYINKVDLPSITYRGKLVCIVDPMTGTVTVQQDSGIINAMNVYVIRSVYG